MYLINKITETIRNAFEYRRVCYELNNLTDRDLADIGITRGDIHGIAMREVHRHTLY